MTSRDSKGTPEGDFGNGESNQRVTLKGDTGVSWVTLRDAEHATGVAVSTLRKWRKQGDLESHLEPGPTGERIVVPLKAVQDLAAQRRAGGAVATPAAVPVPEPPSALAEPEPPKWAMELLARADARTEALLDRLRQAEEERADAQRDARIAEHKLESARSEAEELRGERDRLRTQFERAPKRWWQRS